AAASPSAPAAPAGPPLDPYASPAQVQIQVLLDDRLAKASAMGALDGELAVSPKRLIVVSDHQKLWLVGWGGVAPVDAIATPVEAYAYTPDGLMLAVRGNELAYLDEAGELKPMFTLPSAGMGLATGATTVFLYDRTPGTAPYAIYELAPGRRAERLLESPEPIDAVAQAGTHTFFASAGVAFEATPGAPLRALAALPSGAKVRSLAATADGSRVYLSDGDSIFAVEGERVALVTRSVGGVLRMHGDALLVLDPKRRLVARLVGLR
ncbi:MAG: hypothetical protein ACM31C_30260, partial [Acidobacteriota bacterium]